MTTPPLEAAACELASAAALARTRAGDDPFNPWLSLAGTIELVAAGLHPIPAPIAQVRHDASGHIREAARLLDAIPAVEAPADLDFWKAHVAGLHTNTLELGSAAPAGSRDEP
jgi:hypothetical protein